MDSGKGLLDILATAALTAFASSSPSMKQSSFAETATNISSSPVVNDHAASSQSPDEINPGNDFCSQGSEECDAESILEIFSEKAIAAARCRDFKKKKKDKKCRRLLVCKKRSQCKHRNQESRSSRPSEIPEKIEFQGTTCQSTSDDRIGGEIFFERIAGNSSGSVSDPSIFHCSIGIERELRRNDKPNIDAQNRAKKDWHSKSKNTYEGLSNELVKHDDKMTSILRNYVDRSLESDNLPNVPLTTPNRSPSFIVKLYAVLSYHPELSRIISWLSHGRAWTILDPVEFEVSVLPTYFGSGISLTAFSKRVLNIWGFQRLNKENGDYFRPIYYHESFLRGIPHLMKTMGPDSDKSRASKSSKSNPLSETDLRQLHPLPEICDADTKEESNIIMQLIDKFIVVKGNNARVPVSLCHLRSLGRGRAKKNLKTYLKKNNSDNESGCKRVYKGCDNDENAKRAKKSSGGRHQDCAACTLDGPQTSNVASDLHSGPNFKFKGIPSNYSLSTTTSMVPFSSGIGLSDLSALVDSTDALFRAPKISNPLSSDNSVASCLESKLPCNPSRIPLRRGQEAFKPSPLNQVTLSPATGNSSIKSVSSLSLKLEYMKEATNTARKVQIFNPRSQTWPNGAGNCHAVQSKLMRNNIGENQMLRSQLHHSSFDSTNKLLGKMKSNQPALNSIRCNGNTNIEYSPPSKPTPASTRRGKAESVKQMQVLPSEMTLLNLGVGPANSLFIPRPIPLNLVGLKKTPISESKKKRQTENPTSLIKKVSVSQKPLNRFTRQRSSYFKQVAINNVEMPNPHIFQLNQAGNSTVIRNLIGRIRFSQDNRDSYRVDNNSFGTTTSPPKEVGNNQQPSSSAHHHESCSEDKLKILINSAFLAGVIMGSNAVSRKKKGNSS